MPKDELRHFADFNGLEYTLDELLRLMKKSSVDRGLLLSPPLASGKPAPNERIIELSQRSGGRLYPILTAEPQARDVKSALELAKKNIGFVKGFKIRLGYVRAFAYDRIFSPLYDYAESRKLPVMFHTGDTATTTGSLVHSHPITLDELANSREGLEIVICHFGNPWITEVGELIYKHPNVYADISGLVAGDSSRYAEKYMDSLASRISEAIYFAGGADKVMFGTDYPVETFDMGLKLVDKLKITEEDKENILWRTASKVFFSA